MFRDKSSLALLVFSLLCSGCSSYEKISNTHGYAGGLDSLKAEHTQYLVEAYRDSVGLSSILYLEESTKNKEN